MHNSILATWKKERENLQILPELVTNKSLRERLVTVIKCQKCLHAESIHVVYFRKID